MGIFDGILIASDWDGTLCCYGRVPERTREAINYFMSEGGRFSITSGRTPDYLNEKKHLIRPNTYCICFGGSLVCNIESGEVLREGYLDDGVYEIIDRILGAGVDVETVNVFYADSVRRYTPEKYYASGKRESMAARKYKITFSCKSAADGERLKEFCKGFGDTGYTFARSFETYLELMQTEYTKGISARLLKERLGARLLVGMGDYENDIPLFEKCDLSFAVANAVTSLKDIATCVTEATVAESAAAEVIEKIGKTLRAGEI